MCNLYSDQSDHQAAARFAKALRINSSVGNGPPLPGIFPDTPARIIRNIDGERELTIARWGMPKPAFAVKGDRNEGVTNVRKLDSWHWKRWLTVECRCVVPFTSFAEPGRDADGKSENVWFALSEDRPLAFFAGVWTNWTGVRKVKEGEVTIDIYGFLTTEPNDVVGAVHKKAMPVILRTEEEVDRWLTIPANDVAGMQRPLEDGALEIVARGGRKDPAG